ncbi:MAG: YbjN domain-containing protein [Oscillospiraceae bacterium]|jgi:hypothetical protein|nr:YbjN domain-containing protein [Oscillospiraceae bacterium]
MAVDEYNVQLARQVNAYLRSQNWKFEFNDEDGTFKFGMSLSNKMKTCRVLILVGDEHICTYAICPINCDHKDRAAIGRVNEFITRANYNLRFGNFELDYRDGEVRYKSSHFCGSSIPDLDVVERVVDIPYLMLNRYGNGLLSVIFTDADPAQEIAKIED